MSGELYHVATNGQRTQLGRRFSGHVHVNLSELDVDERADILRMLADIARDPDAHFHEWGDPVGDARAALRLLDLFLAGVDLARLAADVEALRGRVADAAKGHTKETP